ncbi:MAG: hypothetical protein WD152_05635 [Nitriliruptoraceae bacterium]
MKHDLVLIVAMGFSEIVGAIVIIVASILASCGPRRATLVAPPLLGWRPKLRRRISVYLPAIGRHLGSDL